MNKTFLTAVSAIALLAAGPALADTKASAGVNASTNKERTANQNDVPEVTKEDVKEGWNETKEAVSDAADKVSDAAKDSYDGVKAALMDEDPNNIEVTPVTIDKKALATGIIGKPVYNGDERVGKIHDIILDRSGNAVMVIVADGDFFGTGKLAAFNYKSMINTNAQGNFIMPLTEATIKQAAEFSYDRSDSNSGSVRVIPDNGYSVAELLDGQLIGADGKDLAQIDDIHFQDGSADQLVVGYDKTLGLGGEKAALNFGAAKIVPDRDGYDFQISQAKATQFEKYKKTMTN